MRIRLTTVVMLFVTLAGSPAPVLAQLRLVPYVSGLERPVAFAQHPTDPTLQFVVEQVGRIRVIQRGVLLPRPFLDISADVIANGEQGLLGLAFPADYAATGRFYVNYTRVPDGATVVARFKRSADPLLADRTSRLALRWSTGLDYIPQPYSNHNGGCLEFGADGMLYVALGDGGAGDDPLHHAQNTSSLLGKILRIDVTGDPQPNGFMVPAGNPGLPLPEIWSIGWRNPWKFTFDHPARGGTGAMLVADVGQSSWEEVNYEPAARGGRNYGWRNREGSRDYLNTRPPAYLPLTNPVHEYTRVDGAAITGGYVYRGRALPHLRGRYVFGDYVARRIWSIALTVGGTGEATAAGRVDHTPELNATVPVGFVSAFGMDAAGELYVLDHRGTVYRMAAVPGSPTGLRIVR